MTTKPQALRLQENFSFHSLQHRHIPVGRENWNFSLCSLLRTKIKNAKRRGKKISLSLTTTIRTGQNGRERSRATKKAANLFQTYCFRWPPVGGWYSVLKVRAGWLDKLGFNYLILKNH